MSFSLTEPILLVGVGGVGKKLLEKAKNSFKVDYLLISNDHNDLSSDYPSIKITTGAIVNPSVYLIRGSAYSATNEIRDHLSKYSTVIMIVNLAGRAGAAIAPVVGSICKESNKRLLSITIMPFKFEKDRIFTAGISLKRLRTDSHSTIVLDNDALLDSNPDLTINSCYEIANNAILSVISSLKSSDDTNILSTSQESNDVETSLKDSIRMLYEDAPPTSVKRSILYILGGNNVPGGVLNTLTNIAGGIFSETHTSFRSSINESEKSKVVMLTSVQGQTHFDQYDPLGIIPHEKTLDWEQPDCSIDCNLDLYQLE